MYEFMLSLDGVPGEILHPYAYGADVHINVLQKSKILRPFQSGVLHCMYKHNTKLIFFNLLQNSWEFLCCR